MNIEKNMYFSQKFLVYLYKKFTKHPDYIMYKSVRIHRKYRIAKENNSKVKSLFYSFFANRISSKYNLELYGKFGKNFRIWHGNIIINGNAVIGDNCNLHGNNCIGEKNGKSPIIGDNVDVGYGTTIIGDVTIANNVVIGANSLVNKSFYEEGVVIAGCPARIIKKI
jgi:hypothetical protein